MKIIIKLIAWIGSCAILFTPIVASAVSFTLSNGTNTLSNLVALRSAETGSEYYNYMNGSGEPIFGAEQDTAFFWLHENTLTGTLGFYIIADVAYEHQLGVDDSGGFVTATFNGLQGARQDVADDKTFEISANGSAEVELAWFTCCTDGAGFTDLESGTISIELHSNYVMRDDGSIDLGRPGIQNWYFLTGNANNPQRILIDPVLGIGVEYETGRSEPGEIPEPSSILLLSTALIGLRQYKQRHSY